MNGYFYAYASKSGAKQSRPEWFFENPITGEDEIKTPRVLVSTNGVWISPPAVEQIDADDPDAGFITTSAGIRSDSYVILSPDADGAPSKLIEPDGQQGFA